jgi:hypothetical protein
MYTDPKELKRQRDREYYARYKDDIQQRWRESNEKKKNSVTLPMTSKMYHIHPCPCPKVMKTLWN